MLHAQYAHLGNLGNLNFPACSLDGFWPMLICYERKILLNGWLILADKHKRIGCSCMVYQWEKGK
jgi:hypothetical protein